LPHGKNGSLWKPTKQLLRTQHPSVILRNNNGDWVHSEDEKANIFSNHFFNTFQQHNNILTQKKMNDNNVIFK